MSSLRKPSYAHDLQNNYVKEMEGNRKKLKPKVMSNMSEKKLRSSYYVYSN